MRAVCLPSVGGVDYFGVSVNAGSRDESTTEYGLAHFVEHTIFKGTRKRRAWHILNRMERVGGELNAFTTKEETVVYTIAPSGNLDRAAELVSDLIANSVFPEAELARERDVVEDEISSYLDTPSEAIYDDFDELIFNGSALAHNILGSSESLSQLSSADCRRWLETHFAGSNLTLFYLGSANPQRVAAILERRFGNFTASTVANNRRQPLLLPPFDISRSNGLHQCHTVWGMRIPSIFSPDSVIFSLISNLLAGPGMNSLLNVELRERRGLVYTVESTTVNYTDCGVLSIYYGCDTESNRRCRDVMRRTLSDVALGRITRRRFEEAKRQYVGQLTVACENNEQRTLSAGRRMMYFGEVTSFERRRQDIADITFERFSDIASTLSPDNFSILTLT